MNIWGGGVDFTFMNNFKSFYNKRAELELYLSDHNPTQQNWSRCREHSLKMKDEWGLAECEKWSINSVNSLSPPSCLHVSCRLIWRMCVCVCGGN